MTDGGYIGNIIARASPLMSTDNDNAARSGDHYVLARLSLQAAVRTRDDLLDLLNDPVRQRGHVNRPIEMTVASLVVPNDLSASALKHADSSVFASVKNRNNQARAGSARRA
jgi:hypothetical protein